MRSMEMIFVILVYLLGGLWETEATSVTEELGKTITITCSHINAFSNVKYFCKGKCRNEDILIRSRTVKEDSFEKYSIKDEGNTFYVTISHLTEDDSGTYWCGIERVGLDTYKKVVLTVIEGNKKDADNDSPQSISNETISTKASSSMKLVYIGAGLGVVVLALAMVLLVFFRYRRRDISKSPGKVHDTVYATPLCQKQDEHHTTTSSPTANDDQETDGRSDSIWHQDTSGDQADNIYSNVDISSESQTQPDGLFYSTVSCNKHTDCSTVSPLSAVTYSTIKYISTDESAVYCNV